MLTQFFEEWNGTQTQHAPRAHASKQAAHDYAAQLSGRRDGQVNVINEDNSPAATYVNGVKTQ